MAKLSLFPTYHPSKDNNIFTFSDIKWIFTKNGIVYDLHVSEEGVIKSANNLQDWNANDFGISIRGCISIDKASMLYSKGKDAVACSDAKIGVALLWTSPTSFQRGVIDLGTLDNCDFTQTIPLAIDFPGKKFRDVLTLDFILFIKEEGHPASTELMFANQQGCIVGYIYTRDLLLDGSGSFFPSLYSNAGKNSPLWKLICEWDDPYNDQWADCVSLNFNRDNKLFKYINNESPENFDIQLLREILSSAIILIVEKLRGDGYSVDSFPDDCAEGSVASVIRYFSNMCNCDFASPMSTSESVRLYIENNLKA